MLFPLNAPNILPISSPLKDLQVHRSYLVDDVDAVVDLLPSEDRVEIVEPVLQVVFSVAEWNDDGYL